MPQNISDPFINGQMPAAPCDQYPGLSKREHFAAQFMAAYIANNDGEPTEMLASYATTAADALLLELAQSEVSK